MEQEKLDPKVDIVSAYWNLELNCECPKCLKYVNLLDAADFWDGRSFNVGETVMGLDVYCPECDYYFEVNCDS